MAGTVRGTVKALLPAAIFRFLQRRRIARIRTRNSKLPTKEVFTEIYRNKVWSASSSGEFRSGSGSADSFAQPYADFVRTFIRRHAISSVVDLGCGDFNVGRHIAGGDFSYTGVDIVEDLVSANRRKFGAPGVEFRCLDIIEDELPPGELCLVRQVFQHLSNDQIRSVLPKLTQYKYVLVSEHYPSDGFLAELNRDKPHGGDTRLYDNSAVHLGEPPFSLPNLRVVHSVVAPTIVDAGEKIQTVLMDNS